MRCSPGKDALSRQARRRNVEPGAGSKGQEAGSGKREGMAAFFLPAPKLLPTVAAVLYAAICGVVLWQLYSSSVDYLLSNWYGGDYSYAWLIPFVVFYLVWEKRRLLSRTPVESAWWGAVPLAFGIAFFWVGELGGEFYTLYISAFLTFVGILWLHLGRHRMRILTFPLFLLLTTFPLPNFLYANISVQLQLISSKAATALLRAMGIVAYREGNVIDIGLTRLQVVEACSGIRYVIPLLVLGLIVAYFFRASLWKRILLVLSAIPLTIFWNSMRVALTGVFWIYWGPQAAEGLTHDFTGFVIFVMSLAVLLGEMWVLGKIGKKPPDRSPLLLEEGRVPGIPWRAHLPVALTTVAVLGITLILFKGIDFRQKIPIREPLSKFPLEIEGWHGTRQQIDPDELRVLRMSDYTMIDYRSIMGQTINFYVAYFQTQFKGGSIHSPETCLPGHGWVPTDAGTVTIPVKYGPDYLKVHRVVSEQLGKKTLVYFWFPQRGRILTSIYQLKLYNFWDALIQHRTDGALVRVITPMAVIESMDRASSRLNEFLSKVLPILESFIPGRELPAGPGNLSSIQPPGAKP